MFIVGRNVDKVCHYNYRASYLTVMFQGTYEKDKKACVQCPKGRYISQDRQTGSDDTACTQCDAGAVALTEGQSECTDCQKVSAIVLQ